jgi:TonB-dependent receptor
MPAALQAAGILNAKLAIPNAQLGQFMQTGRTARYTTPRTSTSASTTVGAANYRCWTRRSTSTSSRRNWPSDEWAATTWRATTRASIDEETTGLFVEANGELEMLGNLRYNVGVRRIETDQFLSGYRVTGGALSEYEKNYDKLLPSFNIASDLGHGLVLRAAASKTMTRPQPGDMAPNGALSINGDVYTIGNPELDPYFAKNFDLGLEWYFGESGLGVIALNAWRKEIEGYTTVIGTPTPFGQLGIDYSTLPIATQTACRTPRMPSAVHYGNRERLPWCASTSVRTPTSITLTVEVTYVQPLDFLLQGPGFTLNYTHIDQKSEGGLPGAPSSAITGLSPVHLQRHRLLREPRVLGPP